MRVQLVMSRDWRGRWRCEVTGDVNLTRFADDALEAVEGVVPHLEAQAWVEFAGPPEGFIDGLPTGCCCTSACECPCFQRIGIDTEPCCEQCAPLPFVEGEAPDGS